MPAVDKAYFFDAVRESLFGGSLTENQVAVMDSIIDSYDGSLDRMAYVLATPYHEVGPDLLPVAENLNYTAERITEVWPSRFKTVKAAQPYAGNPEALGNKVYGGRMGNDEPGDGYRYRGRGLSQITGKGMYEKFGKLMSIDLVGNPDLALDPKVAARILVVGMRDGLFTGKSLADYINPGKVDYVGARAIINADVKANGQKIAAYANKFRRALREPVAAPSPVPKPDIKPVTPDKVSTTPSKSGWAVVLTILGGILTAIFKALGWF